MSGFLLDTCVLSETRKKRADPGVMEFLAATEPAHLFISVLTIGEVHKGAEKKRLTDADAANGIAAWAAVMEQNFAEHILDVDVAVARLWGELSARRAAPVIDTLLAATALVHGLTVVTRNVKDFVKTDARLLNPWLD